MKIADASIAAAPFPSSPIGPRGRTRFNSLLDPSGAEGDARLDEEEQKKSSRSLTVTTYWLGMLRNKFKVSLSLITLGLGLLGYLIDTGTLNSAPIPHPAAHPSSSAIFIPSVIETSNFRTNLGMSNLTGSEANVTVELVDPQGSVLASKQYTVPASGLKQINHVIPDLLGTSPPTDKLGYLILESDQTISAFGVSIDNVTQDGSFIQGTRATATHLLLPTSTSAGSFKTTLTVINDGGSTNQIDLKFRDASGAIQASKSITLAPYGFFYDQDIRGFLGVSKTFGPIEIISVSATPLPIVAAARVYSEIATDEGVGTTGSLFTASPYSP